jgi:hypothetical protein
MHNRKPQSFCPLENTRCVIEVCAMDPLGSLCPTSSRDRLLSQPPLMAATATCLRNMKPGQHFCNLSLTILRPSSRPHEHAQLRNALIPCLPCTLHTPSITILPAVSKHQASGNTRRAARAPVPEWPTFFHDTSPTYLTRSPRLLRLDWSL